MSKVMAGKKEVSPDKVDPPEPGMIPRLYSRDGYTVRCWHQPGVEPDRNALGKIIKSEVFRGVKGEQSTGAN